MRILRAVVQTPMLPMLDTGHDKLLSGGIAGQLVGDHHTRSRALLLEQLSQRRGRISATLNQDVEHDPMLVPVLPTCKADHNLIQVPLVSRCWKTPADLIGKGLAELQRPLAYCLTWAEGKSEAKPDRVADYFSGKAVAGVARVAGWFHALAYAHIRSLSR